MLEVVTEPWRACEALFYGRLLTLPPRKSVGSGWMHPVAVNSSSKSRVERESPNGQTGRRWTVSTESWLERESGGGSVCLVVWIWFRLSSRGDRSTRFRTEQLQEVFACFDCFILSVGNLLLICLYTFLAFVSRYPWKKEEHPWRKEGQRGTKQR